MVGSRAWTRGVVVKTPTRRGALIIGGLTLLGGCSYWEGSRDPYFPAMKKDPMYTWVPEGDLRRSESVSFSSHGPLGDSPHTDIFISFHSPTPGNPQFLIKQAEAARESFGYVNEKRQLTERLEISCYIGALDTNRGLLVILTTPAG